MAFPSLSLFLVKLKTVTEWYQLGIHLGIETHHLDEIAASFGSQGVKVCLAHVYDKYKDCKGGPPSWEVVTEALEKMDKITLADEIKERYLVDTMSTGDSESDDSAMVEQCGDGKPIFIGEKVKQEFEQLRGKYSEVITAMRMALRETNVDIGDLQSVIQDHCGLQPLPSESATLDSVFQRMKEHMSCFDVSLLLKVADQFVKEVRKEIRNYCRELNKFKSSAIMEKIVKDVKDKRKAPSAGARVVTLKVSQAWNNATIRDFEKLVNIVLHEEQLCKIKVKEGCMCITWIAPDVEAGEIVRDVVYNKHFMDAIAVLSLSIGDQEIYRRQDQSDTPVSLDSALLQAIEKGVIDAVELLLAVGANPYLSLPSGDAAIGVAGKMMDDGGRTILHKACWYGHCDLVSLLLDGGRTILHKACWYGHCDLVSLLLAEGFDPNIIDYRGSTPLIMACHRGNYKLVSTLLSAGADVNKSSIHGMTPLIAACERGHFDIVSNLLSAGADVNQGDHTLLMVACWNGNVELVSTLLSAGADINKSGRYDTTTPLTAACRKGHSVLVSNLLSAGADANQGDPTPLIAACENGNAELVSTLLKAGADINKSGRCGATPLIAACRKGHSDLVSNLLSAGADANQGDPTPLIAACENGNAELVSTLLKAGADINKSGRCGATPLIAACRKGHSDLVSNLLSAGADANQGDPTPLIAACENGNAELVSTLLKAGADINKSGRCGATPLIAACRKSHSDLVSNLLSAGADANQGDPTPLTAACENGNAELVSTLLSAGADVNKSGTTPLTAACRKGHSVLVSNLLSAGADANQGDPTPLTAACENGNAELVSTLLSAGADVNKSGTTPLTAACRKGHSVLVSNLLSAGADANQGDPTPLTAACENGNAELVSTLLSAGADIKQANKDGTTPLIAACQHANSDAVSTLLKAGADVNNQDDQDGTTPLLAVITGPDKYLYMHMDLNSDYFDDYHFLLPKRGINELVSALIDAGANVNNGDRRGTTPLIRACERGDSDLVSTLLKAGADVNQGDRYGTTPLDKAKTPKIASILYDTGRVRVTHQKKIHVTGRKKTRVPESKMKTHYF